MIKMQFKKITPADYEIICPLLEKSKINICDFSCGSVIMWHDFYKTEYCIEEGFLYFRDGAEAPSYTCPIGEGDFEKAVKKLEELSIDGHLCFNSVTVDMALKLKGIYGDKMKYEFNRDLADYIYKADSLITFAGKKLSAVRNHLNRFKATYPQYKFSKVTDENIDRVKEFFKQNSLKRDLSDEEALEEAKGNIRILDYLDKFQSAAGFVEVDGEIISASVGEYVGDMLIVHVEKANTEYTGAYQIMVSEFAREFVHSGIKYINREDDVGLEGLRKSKLAYRPLKLLDKAEVDIKLSV